MPEISRFYGIIIKMYFNEHNPPHFHVEYQGFKAKIEINTRILEGKMPKTAINLTLQCLSNIDKNYLTIGNELRKWNL